MSTSLLSEGRSQIVTTKTKKIQKVRTRYLDHRYVALWNSFKPVCGLGLYPIQHFTIGLGSDIGRQGGNYLQIGHKPLASIARQHTAHGGNTFRQWCALDKLYERFFGRANSFHQTLKKIGRRHSSPNCRNAFPGTDQYLNLRDVPPDKLVYALSHGSCQHFVTRATQKFQL